MALPSSKTYDRFRQSLLGTAHKHGDKTDVAVCARVLSKTAEFLAHNGASPESTAALESLGGDNVPRMNVGLVQRNELSTDLIMDFVKSCKVLPEFQMDVALECGRIIDGASVTKASHFQRENIDQKDHVSVESYVGRTAARSVRYTNDTATEAFGADIDKVQQDNRITIVLAVLRSFTSIIDKVLPRVMEESNVVSIWIPAPEVYNLAASMSSSSAVRNSALNRTPLVELFKYPDVVSTQQRQIIVQKANDTGEVACVYGQVGDNSGTLNTNVQANLFDLTLDSTMIGYNAVDYTDLVAEGGRISKILVQATKTSNGVVTTEVFSVPVDYIPSAPFVQSPNNIDSGDVISNIVTPYILRSNSVQADGVTQTAMFANYTDAAVQIDVNFNAQLNLKTANITGSGSVNSTLRPRAGLTTGVSAATTADFANVKFQIIAYTPELFFDEENLRKTSIAVRCAYLERQFVIPMGRNFVVDYALQQSDDGEVTATLNKVMAIGNSIRGLDIIQSRLTEVSGALAFALANPEQASVVSPTRLSIAATLCLPYVVMATLDFADAKTAIMRESERLSDMHARLRELLLNVLATVCAQSLYLNNLEAGEKPVFKCTTYSVIGDLIFGILDYHNTLTDVVTAENGCDYSFQLPNGYRIDLIKTTFVDYEGIIMVVPVREADKTHVTSFGTIRDRGTYTAQYNPINNGGVSRRIVANSREIVFPTNPVGAIIKVLNISAELGTVSPM